MFDIFIPALDTAIWWPGIILLGVGIGFLTGMYGVGGGFLLTPFLKIAFGLPYPSAVGCSILLIFMNSIIAVWGHWKKKSVDFLLGGIMAGGAIAGTEIGVRMLSLLHGIGSVVINGKSIHVLDIVLNCLFLLLMMWVCISIIKEIAGKRKEAEVKTNISRWLLALKIPPLVRFTRSGIEQMSVIIPIICSLFVGIFTGLLGIGGGFINLPLLIYVIGTPTLVAVGTSLFTINFASAYGAFRHFNEGNVIVLIVALLFVGSFFGVKLGIILSHRFGGRRVRLSFIFIILTGMVIVVFDLINGFIG